MFVMWLFVFDYKFFDVYTIYKLCAKNNSSVNVLIEAKRLLILHDVHPVLLKEMT